MTLGSHQTTVGKSQVHLTPRWLIDALGPFDLDPAAADPRPWDVARCNFTEGDDGLSRQWTGRVFLNPPFHRYEVGEWTSKMAAHGHGILLTHARCEAAWFLPIWKHASGILFLAGRIKFCKVDGTEHPYNSGAPALLASFGAEDLRVLQACGLAGVLVTEWARLTADNGCSRPPLDLFAGGAP
jgi:DNA N-6-adenine-methyltransferase (Dam)